MTRRYVKLANGKRRGVWSRHQTGATTRAGLVNTNDPPPLRLACSVTAASR
jgi:hypothetical protein